MTFQEKVLKIVLEIPKGEILTYKEVAVMAGSPNAARAVGNLMKKNYKEEIPCHRVIRSDGKLGGYNRGEVIKRKKLEVEGLKRPRFFQLPA